MGFGRIVDDFLLCFRTNFCRSLHGEQPQQTIKTCQKPSEIYITKLHSTHLPFCKTPATATNARNKAPIYTARGAAVLAPHGAFRSAAPCLWQAGNGVLESLCQFLQISELFRLQKPHRANPLPPTPTVICINFNHWPIQVAFFQIFLIFLLAQKIIKNRTSITPPNKSQKSDPWVPKARVGSHFGPQWILQGVAKATFWSIMFEKTRKRRSRNGSRKNMNVRWIFDAKMRALHM
jgi:hypothetical protein